MPTRGYVIYGVAHQHSGAIKSALYGEDGHKICTSITIYGEGKKAGNEAGHIVGMTTCYPQAGSMKISDGETLTLESNYSSSQMHIGVTELFYLYIADQPSNSRLSGEHINEYPIFPNYSWALVVAGVAIIAFVVGHYIPRKE